MADQSTENLPEGHASTARRVKGGRVRRGVGAIDGYAVGTGVGDSVGKKILAANGVGE